ncbi:TPA: hypothetical protein MXR76_004639 [Pseudomonas aeruginosa]|uniref:WD40/YVTN/BNR-like repeat-containing protein n=1 Tax=Pseudomonas aeruginosa TaxID=287 RepID=UPI000B495929|nr:YCF48-related protein [Pseudomonas aeruginosa]MBG4351719.1 hypothetical protein [Pseudomonas aeruginosa]MCU9105292.1 YCF48-related protein [Pseudomonas aeruginosa]MCU9249768.1 YCF48-related protein [Pseudomonas aeruginosa]MCU9304567.1 YCF48-related protein [Pseudomonas aeruginosa]MCU9510324.1 YCF48-related protein [Pseudomonas aeruginosa]
MRFNLGRSWLTATALAYVAMVYTGVAASASVSDALDRPSIALAATLHPFLLGASQAGSRLVVVGERGVVMLSDDGGVSWRQSPTPTSVTLTGVSFADDTHGFAVGHGGVVLATHDAGATWERRLDGREIARQLLADAERSGDERRISQAQRFIEDGPDKPLLDLLVLDASHIIVVGAFGLALSSYDGGRSWVSWKESLDNAMELHLYAIRARGALLVVAGEQGLVRISDDAGKTFSTITTPYNGSFFTLELMGDNEILLAGMRGNVWRSRNRGQTWQQMETPAPASIVASRLSPEGTLVLVSQAGQLLTERGGVLHERLRQPLPQLNGVWVKPDASLLLLGQQGARIVEAGDLK